MLGCVDSRVDPSDVLGLELGEGVVMRNIGGRITPATLRSWALLGRLSQGQSLRSGHLVILHHTDCGIRRLADYPEQLAAFFEIPVDELESKVVADPYAAVRVDTAIARHTLPPSRLVSGLVYDVNTGLIEIVDPATQEQQPCARNRRTAPLPSTVPSVTANPFSVRRFLPPSAGPHPSPRTVIWLRSAPVVLISFWQTQNSTCPRKLPVAYSDPRIKSATHRSRACSDSVFMLTTRSSLQIKP
ncbi:MAG: carbonic anhydrase [Trebonia sp.]